MADENSSEPTVQGDEMSDFTPNQYTGIIWNYLLNYSSFTQEGIAALMGNMWAESGCTPYACQPSRPKNICEIYIEEVDNNRITRSQFINGGCSPSGGYTSTQLGFGLVQWTYTSRKQGIYDYIFPNYPSMGGSSIGDIYKQLEYILIELSSNFASVGAFLSSSNDIDACSDIVLEAYENPQIQTQAVHELRRKYSNQVYDIYGSGTPTLHIYLDVNGNGTAGVSNTTPSSGDTVTLTCTPNAGESLIDIIATTISGMSVALDPTLLIQTFTMPNESILISVFFTGTTPPTPSFTKKTGMPIWMYPMFMKGR